MGSREPRSSSAICTCPSFFHPFGCCEPHSLDSNSRYGRRVSEVDDEKEPAGRGRQQVFCGFWWSLSRFSARRSPPAIFKFRAPTRTAARGRLDSRSTRTCTAGDATVPNGAISSDHVAEPRGDLTANDVDVYFWLGPLSGRRVGSPRRGVLGGGRATFLVEVGATVLGASYVRDETPRPKRRTRCASMSTPTIWT